MFFTPSFSPFLLFKRNAYSEGKGYKRILTSWRKGYKRILTSWRKVICRKTKYIFNSRPKTKYLQCFLKKYLNNSF